MTKTVQAIHGSAAGRDINSTVSLDLEIAASVTVGQSISIGTMITGPVHIQLVVTLPGQEPDAK